MFTASGGVWIMPISGCSSMDFTMRTMVRPLMTLSASNTIMYLYCAPQRRQKSATLPLLRLVLLRRRR